MKAIAAVVLFLILLIATALLNEVTEKPKATVQFRKYTTVKHDIEISFINGEPVWVHIDGKGYMIGQKKKASRR